MIAVLFFTQIKNFKTKFCNFSIESFAMYTKLYQKWLVRATENDDPTNDCLGVARIVFCTYQYKYCDQGAQTDVIFLNIPSFFEHFIYSNLKIKRY